MGRLPFFSSLLCLFFLLFSSSSASSSCEAQQLVARAFSSVSGFNISQIFFNTSSSKGCSRGGNAATEIRLPGRNLTGTVSWALLRNVTNLTVVDLSGNSLHGSVPTSFWSSPGLREVNLASNRLSGEIGVESSSAAGSSSPLRVLNLSNNRLTHSARLSGFSDLRVLDLSMNGLRSLPSGIGSLSKLERLNLSGCNLTGDVRRISGLASLKHLDISGNSMSGSFPSDFPPIAKLESLNISSNNFSGMVGMDQYTKFGSSAFSHSGARLKPNTSISVPKPEAKPRPKIPLLPKEEMEPQHKEEKSIKRKSNTPMNRTSIMGLAAGGAGVVFFAAMALLGYCILRKRRQEKKNQWTLPTSVTAKSKGAFSSIDPEAAWVAESSRMAPAAPVIIFEKPLMTLTFSDLVAATSGFGRESQLADGARTGPLYRAVFPVEMQVAVKVFDRARGIDEAEAKAAFHELAGLKHPNLLPLLGFCIAGKAKLLLYEYMENGDLHRWIHELPLEDTRRPEVDDWAADARSTGSCWATRHRIALGIARGLAFLHHATGTKPLVHGQIASSNVLLDDEFQPRLTGFGLGGGEPGGSTEADVHGFGVVLLELMTGRVGSDQLVRWVRELVRGGKGSDCLDPRVRVGGDGESEEREMVEAVRVAYLCTAESAEKRPSMRQVVGLLKDVRPSAV